MQDVDRVYLDHNATCPLQPAAREVLVRWRAHGNPSSAHAEGRAARAALEDARQRLAHVVDCEPDEVVFTSGGTESNALALGAGTRDGTRLVASIEHPSLLGQPERRTPVARLDVASDGRIDPEALAAHLAARGGAPLVSIGLANHEIGVVQAIEALAAAAHRAGALLHTDASQALGRIDVSFRRLGADLMTLSGHKVGAPVGIGALIVRSGIEVAPLLGGGTQQGGLRAGTEPVLLAAAFAAAATDAVARRDERAPRHRAFCGAIVDALRGLAPDAIVNSPLDGLPNTLNVSFPGRPGPSLVHRLDLEGVAVSHGSACASGSLEPSPVLLALGAGDVRARTAVRISFGPSSTERDVELFLERLARVLDAVRPRALR